MRRPGVALALASLLLGAAPSVHGPARGERAALLSARGLVGCAASRPGGSWVSLASGGLVRWALVHVPPAASSGRTLPLVLALHGVGGNGRFMEEYTGLSRMSDQKGFVVAYPAAYGSPARWNIAGPPGTAPDDVAFARDLLGALEARLCIDPSRVYATGVSNGGGMAARLGCELSDRLRAIAPVAGGYSTLPPCGTARALSVLEIHGTSDRVVPYAGRGPSRAGSARGFLRGWAQRDGCPSRAVRSVPARRVVRLDWAPCEGGTAVAHLKVLGGTHEWPEAIPEHGDRSPGFSASEEVWRFFAARH
jgi:polyhydroxybutyrate depolymerase